MKMGHTKFRRRGITPKKDYNMHNTAKVRNQEHNTTLADAAENKNHRKLTYYVRASRTPEAKSTQAKPNLSKQPIGSVDGYGVKIDFQDTVN
jgi:hypothetical protein